MAPILRTLLFVPADRPERFAKAVQSGADAVCVDLEDAVLPAAKDAARAPAIDWLAQGGPAGPTRALRINAVGTLAGLRDLQALLARPPAAGLLLLPKSERPADVLMVHRLLREAGSALRLLPLIETVQGTEQAGAIAACCDRVDALLFGGVDLALELGVPPSWEALLLGRQRLVYAAAGAGVAALDVPFVDTRDAQGCSAEARRSRALGFTGKAAIHPAQVAPIHEAFSADPDELLEAARVVAAARDATAGAVLVDGRMIDAPVVLRMQRLLAAVERAG